MFLYANKRLLASPLMERIQESLDVFTGMFNRVVIPTNVNTSVGMTILLATATGKGPLSRVRGGVNGVVSGVTLPRPTRYGSGTPVRYQLTTTIPQAI